MFWNKPKITFDCHVAGVERIMPMIPAREFRHPWVNRAVQELANLRKDPSWGTQKLIHTAKCPGIFQLQRHGWIMRTWQDITIETNGDGVSFLWTSAIDQKSLDIGADYVSLHPHTQLADYMENWKPDTLRTLIKIVSPWGCNVPEGYYLLETGIPYADENRFTTVSGFYSKEQGYAQMNPQMMWHVPKGKVLIKAGTPIAHYMLVPKEQFDMNIKVVGSCTDEGFFNLANSFRFIKNYRETKQLFKGNTK